jgi:hypothetical protein
MSLCDKVCKLLATQVGGFLRLLRFPPPIKLTAMILFQEKGIGKNEVNVTWMQV